MLNLALCTACIAAEVRVRNDTGEDLRNVVVGHRSFGSVGTGRTTQYQVWDEATSTAQVSARSAAGTLGFWPKKPHVLERLQTGRYTYVLSISNGKLEMHAEKDPE